MMVAMSCLAVIAAGCRPSQQQARDAGAGAAPEAAAPGKAPKQGGTLTLSLQKDITGVVTVEFEVE